MSHQFPVAFDLIKPVLERTNNKQLETIEYYSPVNFDFMINSFCYVIRWKFLKTIKF